MIPILQMLPSNFALICVDILHGDVDRLFFYKIPAGLEISVGQRVRVPFGLGDSIKIGYVMEVTQTPTDDIAPEKVKEIHSRLDDFPVLTLETIELAFWMQKKYYTTLAACVRAIVPGSKSDGKFPVARKKPKFSEITPVDITLTDEQEHAVSQILQAVSVSASASVPPDGERGTADTDSRCLTFSSSEKVSERARRAILLHGVTGSGKTEVYLHAIEKILAEGRQAIVLVPEIALTPQMVALFSARFGSAVAVTHSRLTQAERFQIWKMALSSEISLVIGPRSAVFAPFPRLGLIVIDEEHEHTYHSETAPKYDAREVALKRAEICDAAVVLGSATPSLESYFKAREKLMMLVPLTARINKTLPEIHIVDMRNEMRRGNASIFSQSFSDALAETLAAGRQAILFLNRRGHSSFVSCRWCGHVMGCESCRVNHTYHADKGRLLCHYCGKGTAMPARCPICESEHIKKYGTGTQKVEAEITELFPDVKVLRMDMDTTRGKHGHAKILDAFRAGEAQILIGTQMVAKGLDFPNVTLVGVIAADMSLHTGDFRAGEHTFQILTQVAGRAGRRAKREMDATGAVSEANVSRAAKGAVSSRATEDSCVQSGHSIEAGSEAGSHEKRYQGKVFIQTFNPEHYAIALAEKGDYEKFFAHEIALREAMIYPPFSHVFSVMLTGTQEREVVAALQTLAAIMEYVAKRDGKERFELMGLSPAFVSMIKKQFRWKLLVKSREEATLVAFVLYCIKKLKQSNPLKNMTLHLTLNPIMME
ncbi:MAG: primosomal protein N' [Defluviitaleaceae bacterium]|nr:primosomal protein N' [Defluviitaleaceae bacterium]